MNGFLNLSSKQRKFLRGLAHGLAPVVLIGIKGVGEDQIRAVEEALLAHELIKVRFLDQKGRAEKEKLTAQIAAATGSVVAGAIGHIAILYRPHPDPQKRRIVLDPVAEEQG